MGSIVLRKVEKVFGDTVVIPPIDLEIADGEFTVFVGPSGCGKSTLLKAIAGFVKPVEGGIFLHGRPVDRPGPDRMMVFQEFDQLLPWKTVRDNVAFPMLSSRKFGRREAHERAKRYIDLVNLGKFAASYPHQLSGGMKQRVAIARAMAMEPDILLMDEPFASLDALTRRKMQDELLAIWRQVRCTIVFVTHSIEEAILLGSRILVLSPHPGRVRALWETGRDRGGEASSEEFRALHDAIEEILFGESLMQEGAGI